eukprot:8031818-Pyramimonas_sp.AAC.1
MFFRVPAAYTSESIASSAPPSIPPGPPAGSTAFSSGPMSASLRRRERGFFSGGCVRLVRRENIPVLPASDWSVRRIYPCFLKRVVGGVLAELEEHLDPLLTPF